MLECLFLRVKDDSLSPRWAPRVPPAGLILREVGDGFCFKKKLMVLMVSKQPLTLAWGKPTSTTQLPTKHRRNSYSRLGETHKYENRPQPSRNQVLPNFDCGSRKPTSTTTRADKDNFCPNTPFSKSLCGPGKEHVFDKTE